MKTSLGLFLVSYPSYFIFIYLLLVWQVQPVLNPDELQLGMENGHHPLNCKSRPLLGRCQQDGTARWVEDFFGLEALHTERQRKLRIKLFDRYFSSFSQQMSTWSFLVWFYLLLLYSRSSSIVLPPKEQANMSFLCYRKGSFRFLLQHGKLGYNFYRNLLSNFKNFLTLASRALVRQLKFTSGLQ